MDQDREGGGWRLGFQRMLVTGLISIGCIAAAALFWQWAKQSPRYSILSNREGVRWIRMPTPVVQHALPRRIETAFFQREFVVGSKVDSAIIEVSAFKACTLYVNGRKVISPGENISWYRDTTVDLTPYLVTGKNLFLALVQNDSGPPALHVFGEHPLPVSTGLDWLVSADGRRWHPAIDAGASRAFPISLQYPTA